MDLQEILQNLTEVIPQVSYDQATIKVRVRVIPVGRDLYLGIPRGQSYYLAHTLRNLSLYCVTGVVNSILT